MNSTNYQIWADTFSVGGDDISSSTSYNLRDTLGEQSIDRASSTNYGARIGFREMIKDGVLSLSVGAASVALGTLSQTSAKTGTHTLTVESNSDLGLSVTYSGATLTCSSCGGTNTVTGIGTTAVASSVGTSQFGLNSIYSSGDTTPSATAQYSDAAKYAFNSGAQIISASSAMASSAVFNINYLANISGSETAGSYTTTITYTATANF